MWDIVYDTKDENVLLPGLIQAWGWGGGVEIYGWRRCECYSIGYFIVTSQKMYIEHFLADSFGNITSLL